MERKLVTIRKIKDIKPIENADMIEVAIVDGWQVVVKKGEFKVNDFGVYFEIDSFLPIEDRYEFLRKGCYKKMSDGTEGFRLKTIKLRKQLSQGLLLPLGLFPELKNVKAGDEVTELLKVIKYEPPIPACLSGLMKGRMPSFISKTHQERIQNLVDYFDKYKDATFEESEKLDGTSMTVYYNDGDFGVCSHNIELKENEDNTYWKITKEMGLEDILRKCGKNIAVQGELIGEGIQKNHYCIKGQQFRIFDIWDIDEQRYMTRAERETMFSGFLKVPVYYDSISIFEKLDNVNDLLKYTEKRSMLNPQIEAEGLVFKSTELNDGQIVSFKVINNKQLLKGE